MSYYATPSATSLAAYPTVHRLQNPIEHLSSPSGLGSWPEYFIDLINVLLQSRYDLRRSTKGTLLSSPKCFTEVTKGDISFMKAVVCLPIDIR